MLRYSTEMTCWLLSSQAPNRLTTSSGSSSCSPKRMSTASSNSARRFDLSLLFVVVEYSCRLVPLDIRRQYAAQVSSSPLSSMLSTLRDSILVSCNSAITYATRTQAPPAALILLWAMLLKYLAFTTTGVCGSLPLPRTLWNPSLVTSMTGAFVLSFRYLAWAESERKLQRRSTLTVGQKSLLRCHLKTLMPCFPKWPGWYLKMLVLWWVRPPALPLPAGCFLCFPTRPCPCDT